MEFLNVLAIKKLALAKGCTAERMATIKYRHYVRVTGPDGQGIPGTRGVGLGLAEAKRRLRGDAGQAADESQGRRRQG